LYSFVKEVLNPTTAFFSESATKNPVNRIKKEFTDQGPNSERQLHNEYGNRGNVLIYKGMNMNTRRESRVVDIPDVPPDRIALLLAGGEGTRLRDLTREIAGIPIPKQYCRLYNNSSLLETTISRTRLYTSNDGIHIIINRDHIKLATDQVRELPESNIFVQPSNRDTGPGLIFSLLKLNRIHPDAIVAVFPTDHYIDNDNAFIAHTFRATQLITHMQDKIAVLGLTPDRPETGYGYLLPGDPVEACPKTYHVKAFCEKPSLSRTYEIMSQGGLWNTFVMVFRLGSMLDILNKLIPDKIMAFSELIRSPRKADEIYQTIDSWNFSTQVLTRIPQHIVMLEIDDVYWSDWGTQESIERTYKALKQVPFWKQPLHRPIRPGQESANDPSSSQFIA
jgi:mannose-1-phosphate guanylyltransferase